MKNVPLLLLAFLPSIPATAAEITNEAQNQREVPEYTLNSPGGWSTLKNRRFHQAWIKVKKDPLSPQIYLSINRGIPEPTDEQMKRLAKEMRRAVSETPDGKLMGYISKRVQGMLRIDFCIRYSVYYKKTKQPMVKLIRAFFSRGDQYLFMALFREKERKTAEQDFEKTTASFKLNLHTKKQIRRYGILNRAVNTMKKYWYILLPILLFPCFTIWKSKKKQIDGS